MRQVSAPLRWPTENGLNPRLFRRGLWWRKIGERFRMRRASYESFGPSHAPLKLLPLPVQPGRKTFELSPALNHILAEIQRELGYQSGQEEFRSNAELEHLIHTIAARLGFELSSYERDLVLNQIESESKPFGILQELVDDPRISDIIVSDWSKVTIQIGRRNFATDIRFASPESYQNFLERLMQRAGTSCSTRHPIADGMIGAHARIHAVHDSLCDTGPYLTIRLNRFPSVTVGDLEKSGLAPKEIFSYLGGLIEIGRTVLIVGEVGTGKTTLARALAGAIPGDESILVIEDTPEIRLQHAHVRYVTTREENADSAGRISPSQCIRAGMRMAMNRIIFGEMRDAEAAEAFIDVCASGHSGLSTIHARSTLEAVARLELFLGRAQKGASKIVLIEQIATAVQAIVQVDICKYSGKRRIMEIREIGPVADGVLRQREIFRYEYSAESKPQWRVQNKLSAHKAQLESLDKPVCLGAFPAVLSEG
ncbi:MAG: hypothetical protein DCC75_00040 [Proteobacteria bacterium]|nr:MAG: hypothetical protein DCC75_00040 [Pseudomonadota bacterium]